MNVFAVGKSKIYTKKDKIFYLEDVFYLKFNLIRKNDM